MYDFIKKCIQFGVQIGKTIKNPENYLSSRISKPNRESLRRRLISIGNQEHKKRMNQFTDGYCSVAVDEGTTLHTQYLDFVLHNTRKELGEYPASIQKMNGITADCYTTSILNGLLELLKYNLVPSTIVVDGGTAQKKALSLSWKGSIYNITNNQIIRKIIPVPCICHRINNAYKHAFKSCKFLKAVLTKIREISAYITRSKRFKTVQLLSTLDGYMIMTF